MNGFEQTRARWFLGGCVGVFTIPFFIAGVAIIRAGIVTLHRGDSRGGTLLLGFGIAFTAFALGFVGALAYIMRGGQMTARRMEMNPAQPWLWRADWAERRVAEAAPPTAAALWIFALMWNAIAVPIALVVGQQFRQNHVVGVVYLFAAVGVALLVAAGYQSLQRHKFGRSICAIDRLPVEPGQTLSGTIEHRGTQVPEAGYRVALSCTNRIVTGVGRSRSVTNDVLWDAEQRISGAMAAPSPVGMRVPFSFDLPADKPSTDLRTPSDSIIWQLEISAELPGIDYKATFQLPVFATSDDKFAAHYAARREEAARRALPPDSRVSEAPLPSGGIEVRVSPLRSANAMTTFVIFLIIWFGAIAFMWNMGAPRFFAGVFALFGLLVFAMAVDFFAGTSTVSADRAGLRARRTVLGIATTKSIDAAQIDAIEPKVAGSAGNHPYFDVEARLKDRSSRTLARYFERRSDAEAVAAKLWAALFRQ